MANISIKIISDNICPFVSAKPGSQVYYVHCIYLPSKNC